MTQDNKDAALELEKECGFVLRDKEPAWVGTELVGDEEGVVDLYNAARKPWEEENENLRSELEESHRMREFTELLSDKLSEHLLATQEAYQRVHNALLDSNGVLSDVTSASYSLGLAQLHDNEQALSNPPSLEMVERKKLEDEIAVLVEVSKSARARETIFCMITERKEKLNHKNKLEKMK